MEKAVDIWIGQAEENWLHKLYEYARELYQPAFLPSHDHTHHLRVWNIAKLVLREMESSSVSLSPALVEGLIIAAFFHDLGMAQSIREDHGRLGRDLCQAWFAENGHLLPPAFDTVLDAIEKHDRKEARFYSDSLTGAANGILGILSVADDLEAMGVIGIYRYAEIYLHRGIPLEDLGNRILQNAEQRFRNLSSTGMLSRIIEEYRKQYEELVRFYTQYNLQLEQTDSAEKISQGQLGVINYIRTRSMAGKIRPENLGSLARKEAKELRVIEYFSKLEHELDKARE